MKTYFLSWESDNKRGHSIYDFEEDITPRHALMRMLEDVVDEFTNIKGTVTATQFNRVD